MICGGSVVWVRCPPKHIVISVNKLLFLLIIVRISIATSRSIILRLRDIGDRFKDATEGEWGSDQQDQDYLTR